MIKENISTLLLLYENRKISRNDFIDLILDCENETKNIDVQIDDILTAFDFEKVHKCMELLNWKWFLIDAVPSVEQLKEKAREMLNEVYINTMLIKDDYIFNTGGFLVEGEYNNKQCNLRLSFILEEA